MIESVDYIVAWNDTTYFMVNDSTSKVLFSSVSDHDVIQNAINNASLSSRGSVLIKPAHYSAKVTLKDGVKLMIERGAKDYCLNRFRSDMLPRGL